MAGTITGVGRSLTLAGMRSDGLGRHWLSVVTCLRQDGAFFAALLMNAKDRANQTWAQDLEPQRTSRISQCPKSESRHDHQTNAHNASPRSTMAAAAAAASRRVELRHRQDADRVPSW